MNYAVYRLNDTEGNERHRLMASAYLHITGSWPPKREAYEKICEVTVNASTITEALETVYNEFNPFPHKDFRHHPLSVGDIVVLTDTEKPGAHFCDPIGFTEVPEFFAALTATN